jgi:hypothetical protein
MTMTRPLRRMTLHFSHIFLTDGRTFTRFLSSGFPDKRKDGPREGDRREV